MISLRPTIQRIETLLDEDTEQSITYAALEARLALEKVCYDRLRERHDYISHDQLRRWRPGDVVNTLMREVDGNVAETLTLSISTEPTTPDMDPAAYEYLQVGTQVGFDPERISKMWQALAGLALHVRLPRRRTDHIPDYGDKGRIRAKVEEVLAELKRLAAGTLTFSGLGEEVSFVCGCGQKNKRRTALLRDGQDVLCLNPDCKITWRAEKKDDGFWFEQVTTDVNCEKCGVVNQMPAKPIDDMRRDEVGAFLCCSCGHKNYMHWRLVQVRLSQAAAEE